MRQLRRPLLALVGIALSIIALVIAVNGVQWGGVRATLARIDVGSELLVVCFIICSLAFRAERWRIVTSRHIDGLVVHRATAIGFLFNYIYPARAGDVAKVVYAHRASGIGLGRIAVAAMADRMLDVLVLISLSVAMLLLVHAPVQLGKGSFYLTAGLLMAGTIVAFSPFGAMVLRWICGWLESNVTNRLGGLFRRFAKVFLDFRHDFLTALPMFRLCFVLGLVALSDYAALFWLARAFEWELPALAPIVVWVAIAIGASLPSAPAGLGIHQLSCVMSLGLFNVAPADAFAYSIVLQATNLVGILIYGATLLWRSQRASSGAYPPR